MGDRERWSKLPSWCCGYRNRASELRAPTEGLRQEWRGALSLPFPQLFGLRLVSGLEGVCGPCTVCSEGPQLACSRQSPAVRLRAVAWGVGHVLEFSIAFRRAPLKCRPVTWEQWCMDSSVPSTEPAGGRLRLGQFREWALVIF